MSAVHWLALEEPKRPVWLDNYIELSNATCVWDGVQRHWTLITPPGAWIQTVDFGNSFEEFHKIIRGEWL